MLHLTVNAHESWLGVHIGEHEFVQSVAEILLTICRDRSNASHTLLQEINDLVLPSAAPVPWAEDAVSPLGSREMGPPFESAMRVVSVSNLKWKGKLQ